MGLKSTTALSVLIFSTALLAPSHVSAAPWRVEVGALGAPDDQTPAECLAEGTVPVRFTNVYHVQFAAGEKVWLTLRGSGKAGLVLRDESGRVVAEDKGDKQILRLRYVPRQAGAFLVQIVNHDTDEVKYQLYHE